MSGYSDTANPGDPPFKQIPTQSKYGGYRELPPPKAYDLGERPAEGPSHGDKPDENKSVNKGLPTPEMSSQVFQMRLGRNELAQAAQEDPANAGRYMEFLAEKFSQMQENQERLTSEIYRLSNERDFEKGKGRGSSKSSKKGRKSDSKGYMYDNYSRYTKGNSSRDYYDVSEGYPQDFDISDDLPVSNNVERLGEKFTIEERELSEEPNQRKSLSTGDVMLKKVMTEMKSIQHQLSQINPEGHMDIELWKQTWNCQEDVICNIEIVSGWLDDAAKLSTRCQNGNTSPQP